MNKTELILKSCYVPMPDGVRLAVSAYLPPEDQTPEPRPVVLTMTRYWRAMALKMDMPEFQMSYAMADFLWKRGYVLAMGDVRGTGASFGTREMEFPPSEFVDIGKVIEWVSAQSWCDGRVATSGTSYTADTALMALVTSPSPLKIAVFRALDFDLYRHLGTPGGILNTWFAETWGEVTGAMDRNDAKAVFEVKPFADQPAEVKDVILGVRPVDKDTDGSMLAAAVADHKANFNAKDGGKVFEFIGDPITGHPELSFEKSSLYSHQDKIQESGVPIVYRAGWYDAGTQLGALNIFTSLSNPKHIIVGPWNHVGDFRADPFQPGDGSSPEEIPLEQGHKLVAGSLDAYFKDGAEVPDILEYYTLGENKWKSTKIWPLPKTRMQRLYLSAGNNLSNDPPTEPEGSDNYRVDPTAGSGMFNRWHTQMAKPVHHPDRKEEDKKLLVYDTLPLEKDLEITGHPVIHLYVSSNVTDGQFFVYLEAVDPDGRVRLVTEGQLRAIHRKISDEVPPYKMFGPYHTFRRADVLPLVPGEVAEIAFDLFPISVLFKRGQRIRVAISGADKDVFAPIPGCESPDITIERNTRHASFIDLPVIPED